MAKRRRRRSGGGKVFGWIGNAIGGVFRLVWRAVPLMVVGLLVSGLFFSVRSALYADPGFTLQKIQVHPPHDLPDAECRALEARYLGKNIFRVDLKQIAKSLRSDPEIEWVHVSREFPSTLAIEIKRRVPVAFIQFSPNGPYGLISEDGVILDVLSKPAPSELVVKAYSLGIRKPEIGLELKKGGFRSAVRFMKEYWKSSLAQREPVGEVRLDHLGNVSVMLGAGPLVHLGREPLSRLPALGKVIPLMEEEGRHSIEYVDLQFDDVILKRKGSA